MNRGQQCANSADNENAQLRQPESPRQLDRLFAKVANLVPHSVLQIFIRLEKRDLFRLRRRSRQKVRLVRLAVLELAADLTHLLRQFRLAAGIPALLIAIVAGLRAKPENLAL